MIRLQKTLKILFCVCSFIPALSLLAQSRGGTIDGFVVDSHRIPIPDLHVILLDSNRGDVTDPEGYFVIQNIPPGQYSVKFDHISFTSQTVDGIELHEGESVRLDTVTLDYRILELDGVVVTATRTDRRIVDVAQQINIVPDFRIDERHETTPAESLREEPGITVQKTTHGGGSAMIRGLR